MHLLIRSYSTSEPTAILFPMVDVCAAVSRRRGFRETRNVRNGRMGQHAIDAWMKCSWNWCGHVVTDFLCLSRNTQSPFVWYFEEGGHFRRASDMFGHLFYMTSSARFQTSGEILSFSHFYDCIYLGSSWCYCARDKDFEKGSCNDARDVLVGHHNAEWSEMFEVLLSSRNTLLIVRLPLWGHFECCRILSVPGCPAFTYYSNVSISEHVDTGVVWHRAVPFSSLWRSSIP